MKPTVLNPRWPSIWTTLELRSSRRRRSRGHYHARAPQLWQTGATSCAEFSKRLRTASTATCGANIEMAPVTWWASYAL